MQTMERPLSQNMERILPLVDAFQKLPDLKQGLVLGYAIGLSGDSDLNATEEDNDSARGEHK